MRENQRGLRHLNELEQVKQCHISIVMAHHPPLKNICTGWVALMVEMCIGYVDVPSSNEWVLIIAM